MSNRQSSSPGNTKLDGLTDNSYCSNCKSVLSDAKILGANCAWCPSCRGIVTTSCFALPGWVIGVLVLLSTGAPIL